MERRLKDFAESTFRLEENEGEDKVVSLGEAIRRNVKPGMVLYITALAALSEILRQFRGTKPEFTLIDPRGPLALDIVNHGLVKKVISTGARILNLPNRKEEVEVEIWSYAGISQGFLAGALGTGFIPTRSMIGTSMAEENKDSFRVIDDPFGSGKKIGIIKALNPDLTIIHAWAADRAGNTILAPVTWAVDEWGALASKNKIVVTVERLVSTAFIRQHSPMVRIPGNRVNSVSVVPLGVHPNYMLGWPDVKEFETYGPDNQFSRKRRAADRNPESLDAWIKEWVMDCSSHEDYLSKLGDERIQTLKKWGRGVAWEDRLSSILEKVSPSIEYSEREALTVVAARKIKERILQKGYEVMLCGGGISSLASWVAYYRLKEEDYLIDLMIGTGFFGFAPRPGDPALFNLPTLETCKIMANVVWAYNLVIMGENQSSISILGTGQIDKFGNLNSAKISDELALGGPGGSGDAYQACETLVAVAQSKDRFLEKVPYITVPGVGVKTLVSTLGIFEKLGDDEEFSLTACLPNSKFSTLDKKIKNVKENCGWELTVAPKVEEISPPTAEELMTLRLIAPGGPFTRDRVENDEQ